MYLYIPRTPNTRSETSTRNRALDACLKEKVHVNDMCTTMCVWMSHILPAGRAVRPAGPIVTLRFSCVFVCLSVHRSQSGEARERLNGSSWHVWLFRVSWFIRFLAVKGSQAMLVLSTVEAQLSLHKHNISQKHRKAKKPVANYEPANVRNCWCYIQYSVA